MYAELGAGESPGTGLRGLLLNQVLIDVVSCLLARISLASMTDASSSSRQRDGVSLTLLLVPPRQNLSLLPSHLFLPPLPGARRATGSLVQRGDSLQSHH